jgi:hypothetical protein
MTTNRSEFREYMDAQQQLPPDCTLGFIAWFSVEEAPYDGAAMAKDFDRLGLNTAYLPRPVRPDNAFEKASKTIEGEKYTVHDGKGAPLTAEILIREVSRDAQIVRQLIREVKDSAGRRLLYQPVGELVFYKPAARAGKVDPTSARVRATLVADPAVVSASERPLLEQYVQKFDDAYRRFRDFHDSQKVRGILRSYLLYLNAVQMKPGVYFVHSSRRDELERLQEFANNLQEFNGDHTASMMLLPLADLPHLRTEVVNVFQREAEKDLATVVAEIAKIRSTRQKVSAEAWMKIKAEYDRVLKKATEYSRTLQISQDRTAGAAELALDQLMELQRQIVTSGLAAS